MIKISSYRDVMPFFTPTALFTRCDMWGECGCWELYASLVVTAAALSNEANIMLFIYFYLFLLFLSDCVAPDARIRTKFSTLIWLARRTNLMVFNLKRLVLAQAWGSK
jgi:hypothetical protein